MPLCSHSPRALPSLNFLLHLVAPHEPVTMSSACIGVRVLSPPGRRPGGDKTAPFRARSCGTRSAGAQARVFSGFPRLQELRHPNLAPYIDLYEIRGRAYLLSYHTRATLASLLLADSAVPEAPTGWDREVERDGAAGVHDAAKGVEAVAEGGGEGRRLNAAAGLRVCLQVGRAVEYLHARGLVHGRITPHCILLAPWRELSGQCGAQTVLLSDYGAQHLINGSEDASLVPPLEYCAPEIIAARLLRRANPCAHPPAREPAGGPEDDFQAADDAVLHSQSTIFSAFVY